MAEYDITAAFEKIEEELIASMLRNMDHHRAQEEKEGLLWSQWQTEQLKALERYKLQNQKKYTKQFRLLNNRVEALIRAAHQTGNMGQEMEILEAIKNGFNGYKRMPGTMQAEFFRVNERKLEALIRATTNDMQKAETAVLRMANDQYRKTIFNAQVYANSGAGTYAKAVDMATKDMLAAGLNCVQYANGARHTLSDYADMAIRTASKRAYLQGEGEKRQEWGIATVILNKRGNPCPKCLPFCGKVLIDDVWSGGRAGDGKYPLMSYAISKGLYHPRCKDAHTTYFPGISTADDTWTKEELEKIGLENQKEAKRQYAERQAEKYERLAKYSLDEENSERYKVKADKWKKQGEYGLTEEEKGSVIRYVSPDSYMLNDKLRRGAASELTEAERQWMHEIDKALEKLPAYEGNLNRSLTFVFEEDAKAFFESMNIGEEYIPRQYLSTTKKGVYNDSGQVQIYIQHAKKGKDLGELAIEDEVLYPVGARFRVVNKAEIHDKYCILLEEA